MFREGGLPWAGRDGSVLRALGPLLWALVGTAVWYRSAGALRAARAVGTAPRGLLGLSVLMWCCLLPWAQKWGF